MCGIRGILNAWAIEGGERRIVQFSIMKIESDFDSRFFHSQRLLDNFHQASDGNLHII